MPFLTSGVYSTVTNSGSIVTDMAAALTTLGQTSAVAYATIAALAALPAHVGSNAVIVVDPIRGGIFVWNAANHSTDVANDPGQGVYVAPASAPTGASGAWVRQYSDPPSLAWWGGIGDGATDNARALATWGQFGRYQALLYGGTELLCPRQLFI